MTHFRAPISSMVSSAGSQLITYSLSAVSYAPMHRV